MFYLQIRRVELKNEISTCNAAGDSLKFDIKEITKIVSQEWKELDASKKRHFVISLEVQQKLRKEGKMNDLDALREAVLQNVQTT